MPAIKSSTMTARLLFTMFTRSTFLSESRFRRGKKNCSRPWKLSIKLSTPGEKCHTCDEMNFCRRCWKNCHLTPANATRILARRTAFSVPPRAKPCLKLRDFRANWGGIFFSCTHWLFSGHFSGSRGGGRNLPEGRKKSAAPDDGEINTADCDRARVICRARRFVKQFEFIGRDWLERTCSTVLAVPRGRASSSASRTKPCGGKRPAPLFCAACLAARLRMRSTLGLYFNWKI